jgi:hypothetical protein
MGVTGVTGATGDTSVTDARDRGGAAVSPLPGATDSQQLPLTQRMASLCLVELSAD